MDIQVTSRGTPASTLASLQLRRRGRSRPGYLSRGKIELQGRPDNARMMLVVIFSLQWTKSLPSSCAMSYLTLLERSFYRTHQNQLVLASLSH